MGETNLHSTMFLLIPGICSQRTGVRHDLHSTMFLLIQRCGDLVRPDVIDLHSTMFLLILGYSSYNLNIVLFTFHNVSINS